MVPRCQNYLYNGNRGADIIIRTDLFHKDAWPGLTGDMWIYAESGSRFQYYLIDHGGLVLHASAVEIDGKAYLFSAPSGTGKSTHAQLWQSIHGSKMHIFNDDKPALRYHEGKWFAYGTPWCGKDGININMSAPIGGICFLKQSDVNKIRKLEKKEAVQRLISQTKHRFSSREKLLTMLSYVESIVESIPIFELQNRPELEAAHLSYETMSQEAKKLGL